MFAKVPNVRILVAGGDGTVWILQTLDEIDAPKNHPWASYLWEPETISREFWDGEVWYLNELISELLVQVAEAHTALLDRWQVEIAPTQPPKTPISSLAAGMPTTAPGPKKKQIVFQNYLGTVSTRKQRYVSTGPVIATAALL